MNLPDSAIEFLGSFKGSFNSISSESNFSSVYAEMPMVHCYCFTREEEPGLAEKDIQSVGSELLLFATLANSTIFSACGAKPRRLPREARLTLCEISRPK
jgi:hypothetical protein